MPSNLFAQGVALKVIQFRPTGLTGAIMKKSISGELLYIQDFNEKWRGRVGFSYASLQPRLDTFPVYAVMDGNSGTTVLPGYEVYHQFNYYLLSFGVDFKMLHRKKFSIYSGAEILMGGIDMEYDSYYETLLEESYSGGSTLAGCKFRLGTEYNLNEHAGIFFEACRNMYYLNKTGFFSHNDIGLGFRYTFIPYDDEK